MCFVIAIASFPEGAMGIFSFLRCPCLQLILCGASGGVNGVELGCILRFLFVGDGLSGDGLFASPR